MTNSSLGLKNVNRNKRVESLRYVYQAMDDERRGKMELIAEGLMNVQALVDEAKMKVKGDEENSDVR